MDVCGKVFILYHVHDWMEQSVPYKLIIFKRENTASCERRNTMNIKIVKIVAAEKKLGVLSMLYFIVVISEYFSLCNFYIAHFLFRSFVTTGALESAGCMINLLSLINNRRSPRCEMMKFLTFIN